MHKKIILVILFLFSSMHGMEIELPQIIPMDLWPAIINYAIGKKKKHDGLWSIVNRNCTLQMVCKDFRRMFWDCFTLEEKDGFIHRWLYWNKKGSKNVLDMAISIQASLYPILRHTIHLSELECVRAIVAIGDASIINKIDNSSGYPRTPLTWAIVFNKSGPVQLLLDCPVTDVNLEVPLYTAIKHRRIETIKLLLAHPKIHINAVTEYGDTALFAITESFWTNDVDDLRLVIDLLLNAGIDASIKNSDNKTALDVARYEAQAIVAQELENALVKRNKLC